MSWFTWRGAAGELGSGMVAPAGVVLGELLKLGAVHSRRDSSGHGITAGAIVIRSWRASCDVLELEVGPGAYRALCGWRS